MASRCRSLLARFPGFQRAALPALAGVMTLALLFAAGAPVSAKKHAPGTGLPRISFASPAPDFPFTAQGTRMTLKAFAGKPVVLNFWATWCEPCADELPVFARLRTAYGSDVAFIAISDEGLDKTEPFLAARSVDALAVADTERKIFDLYGVTSLPATLVIARDGTVTHVSIGELDWPELSTALDAVPPSAATTAPPGGK